MSKSGNSSLSNVEGLKVREFSDDDVEPLLAMGETIHREGIYRDLDYNPVKLRRLADAVLDANNSMFCCYVAEYKGTIIGVIAGVIAVHFLGPDLSASDLFLHVSKKHRATRAGASARLHLIASYETWAKRKGAREITIRASRVPGTRLTQKLFLNLEFEEIGLLFRKNVDQDEII
jgi:hypothetical protein